jgi:CheY-like chemotaxis protein
MDSPIYVLFIEEYLGDARLVKEELQSASLKAAIQLEWVDHLETGLQRLAMTRLRRNTEFASTPIIALTALAMPGDRERCLQAAPRNT